MLEAELTFTSGGVLSFCRVSGHAEGVGKTGDGLSDGGFNLLCAAVSVLSRTAARTLEGRPGLTLKGEAPKPGNLWFRLERWDLRDEDWLKGVGSYLLTGFKDLEEEYPRILQLRVTYSE